MEIFFIGVGEACDTAHGNNSSLVTTDSGIRILLDCGFSVPHQYFRTVSDPLELDYVWISHFHGDHYLGLPLLFLRLWEMGRTRSLRIVGQKGIADKARNAMEMAYPGFEKKLSYKLEFHIVSPREPASLGGVTWSTALTQHSQYNLGLLLMDGSKRVYYSGDGRSNKQVEKLIQGCDLAVHEAFNLVDKFPYHGSITRCLKLAEDTGIGRLALVHLNHNFRKNEIDQINKIVQARPHILLPVAGDRITI